MLKLTSKKIDVQLRQQEGKKAEIDVCPCTDKRQGTSDSAIPDIPWRLLVKG